MTKAMLIAAPRSGSGKTSVCRGLVAALAQGLFQDSPQGPARGFSGRPGQSLTVRAFKMGPDYLDPLHLRAASGSVCHNLDPWMMGEAACLELFRRNTVWACPRPGVAVVEGAMGLFDGGDPASNAGSGAALAKLLGIPVVLVVDVAGQARSVAALVKGFLDFDPELRVAGLILNRAGGPSHAALLRAALASALPEVPVFGCLPESAGLNLPGRHLGLLPPEAGEAGEDGKTAALAAWVAEHLDLPALLAALPDLPDLPAPPGLCGLSPAPGLAEAAPGAGGGMSGMAGAAQGQPLDFPVPPVVQNGPARRPRLAVSRDAALFFLYEENLDLLRAAGADIVFFSPLIDAALPEDCCGLYLCGGYPELHGRELAANRNMLESVCGFIGPGGPVYAECGGYMYLMSALTDAKGETWPLVGHFPWACRMESRRQALGYREASSLVSSCLGPAGTRARGHVFHYSTALEPDLGQPAASGAPARLFVTLDARAQAREPEGACLGSVAAAYMHVHFASNPDLARNFVAACARFGAEHGLV